MRVVISYDAADTLVLFLPTPRILRPSLMASRMTVFIIAVMVRQASLDILRTGSANSLLDVF
jgi:hypothetical protein